MYSEVVINNALTEASFGYTIDTIKSTRQKIVVTCTNCKKNIHREYRNAMNRHRCPVINGHNKRCFKCESWKDLSYFNKSPKLSGGVSKMCRECYNKHPAVIKCEKQRLLRIRNALDNGDIEYYLKRRCYRIKSTAKTKKIEFNLTDEFLLDLYNKQNGRCYYTNIPMSNNMKQQGFQPYDAPSLDRINPDLGYIQDNVVWCIFGVNSFKQSLTLKEFEMFVKQINWWFNRK